MNAKSGLVRKLWAVYARVYDGLLAFWPYQNLLELVAEEAKVSKGDHILDLGCGTGNLLSLLMTRDSSCTAVGVDMTGPMLAVAREKFEPLTNPVQVIEADLITYLRNAPSDEFDRIVSMNVLYAIKEQDVFWREVLRVVKPGGRITVTTSVKPGSLPIISEHFRHSTLRSLLTPKLSGVFVIDALINLLGRGGTLPFHDEVAIRETVEAAGGAWLGSTRCYGGADQGVNTLFSVAN